VGSEMCIRDRDYSTWLSKKIWRPIGAHDALLWVDERKSTPRYFCCLQARARDWARVGELIRKNGEVGGKQVVSQRWIEQITTPSSANRKFGMNIWRGNPHAAKRYYSPSSAAFIATAEPFLASDVFFIDGAGGQRVYVVPSAGLTVVRIGAPRNDWDDSKLLNYLLSDSL